VGSGSCNGQTLKLAKIEMNHVEVGIAAQLILY